MKYPKSELGKKGEVIAAKFLKNNGYSIIETNYRYGHGEVDIIAGINDLLVFVEVKTRSGKTFGDPVYSITAAKLAQVKKIAGLYLYQKELTDVNCRIDAITVDFSENESPKVVHYKNIS